MDKFLHMWRDSGASCGEEVGIFQSQFFAHEREDGLVQHLILQMQSHWRTLAVGQIFDVVLAAYRESMIEQLTLHNAARLNLLLHAHIDLLPETGHGTHTGGMLLTHGLLHLQRVSVDNQTCANGDTQDLPSLLKNVSEGQEVHHAVFRSHRHTFAVGLHCCMILPVGQNHTL